MEKLIIGSHVSFKKQDQLLGSVIEAISYGSNAFMIYTGAPQNTARSPIDKDYTLKGYKLMEEHNIDINNVVVHAPYIVNLAGSGANYNFAIMFLKEEIKRVEELGITKLVLHPGSHVKLTREEGINNIINALNIIVDGNSKVDILLETMAGKGTEIGITFEEIKTIIDGVKYNEHIKVCLDTCHINDAGYLISDFDNVLKEFDKVIGLPKLACIHINDSINEIGAKKDRHANFGKGTLGFDNLINVIYHKHLKDVPKILETPYVTVNDESKERLYPPYKFEIEMIKNRVENPNLIEDIRAYYKKF
ncbi:MAG: deoxyribonuclease IV [Bacilli bacterium]|nr:deoxyribonuclease IV [Bacilli bacterium]MDD4282557.1 deoxyribonuclease IV [Bacilli bacterium]MDD4718952.1 deoxyribonuclease IV [Bacilli bacterium]